MSKRVGDYQTIRASGITVKGDYNKVIGDNNVVKGDFNQVFGIGNQWTGDCNKTKGPKETQVTPENVIRVDEKGRINMTFNNHSGESRSKGKRERKEEDELHQFIECPLESDKDTPLPLDIDEDVPSCVICTANMPCCVIIPCMHKSFCCACSRVLAAEGTKQRGEVKCPICQGEVQKIAKVFE